MMEKRPRRQPLEFPSFPTLFYLDKLAAVSSARAPFIYTEYTTNILS